MDVLHHREDVHREERILATVFSQSWFRGATGTGSNPAMPTVGLRFPSLKCVEVSGLYSNTPLPMSTYWGIPSVIEARDGAERPGGSLSPLDEMMDKEEAETLKEPYL